MKGRLRLLLVLCLLFAALVATPRPAAANDGSWASGVTTRIDPRARMLGDSSWTS